jgi:membrane-bound metal-dependent hydrolase YbcI (DUF457 family)
VYIAVGIFKSYTHFCIVFCLSSLFVYSIRLAYITSIVKFGFFAVVLVVFYHCIDLSNDLMNFKIGYV